jgi:DNA-binding response OmpR family regulator
MKTDSIAFSGASTTARSYRRALVADDCPVVRKAHSKMLERLGFDVLSVKDGSQALGALAQISFDVVLMDCEMPIMDEKWSSPAEKRPPLLVSRRAAYAMNA